jgi:hypothetical protein
MRYAPTQTQTKYFSLIMAKVGINKKRDVLCIISDILNILEGAGDEADHIHFTELRFRYCLLNNVHMAFYFHITQHYLEARWLRHEADHSQLSWVKVKNTWKYISSFRTS